MRADRVEREPFAPDGAKRPSRACAPQRHPGQVCVRTNWLGADGIRRGPFARAVVAKERARIAYYVLSKQEAFNGACKGTPLSRTKQPPWPRQTSPAA